MKRDKNILFMLLSNYHIISNITITIQNQNSIMQYPALEDVYDLSTDDLKKIQQQLRAHPNGHEDLLETIILEIQQRKALQYFSQLCHADNPYARKVAAFNEQFLRLAAEAIQKNHNARTQGVGVYQPMQLPVPQQSKQKSPHQPLGKQEKLDNNQAFELKQSSSVISDNKASQLRQQTSESSLTHTENASTSTTTASNQNQDAISITTTSDINSKNQSNTSRVSGEVKMNLGGKKGKGGKMKQIMQNTLARTLVEDEGIIRRNNTNAPNPHKKFHVPGQHRQKIEQTNKKSNQNGPSSHKSIGTKQKQDNKSSNKKIGSTGNIGQKHNSQQSKHKREVAAKIKQESKKGNVKLPKINQYKDLVSMVKQEEQKKKVKVNKSQNSQKLPPLDPQSPGRKHLQDQYQSKTSNNIDQKVHHHGNHEDCMSVQSEKRSMHDDVIEEQKHKVIDQDQVIDEEEMEESLSPKKIQKLNEQSQRMKDWKNIERKHEESDEKRYQEQQTEYQQGSTKNNKMLYPHEKQEQQNRTAIIENGMNRQNTEHRKSETNGNQQLSSSNKVHISLNKNIEFSNKIITHQRQSVSQKYVHEPNSQDYKMKKEMQQQLRKSGGKSTNQNREQIRIIQIQSQDTKQQVDYNKKLLQEIEQEQINKLSPLKKQRKPSTDIKNNEIQQNEQKQLKSVPSAQTPKQGDKDLKKCYSEQYWAHIRQQAELKIKRFKQQKQYEERRQIERHESANSHNSNSESDDSQAYSGDAHSYENVSNSVLEQIKLDQAAFEQQMAQKNQQLNKLKKEMMKKTNKKIAQAQPAPRAPPRPKPQFPYLEHFPSFNHIFSIMYLKPQHQALSELPNIMRDIKTLFTTHMEHFSNRTTFKPAIFLPFDHNGVFQLTDPKQLIAHAQETYIDLKVMIQRVQMFNNNLHGEYDDAKGNQRYFRVVKTKEEVYDIISTSFMRRKGWKELPHGCSLRASWNLFWSWSKPDVDLNRLLVFQKINHFPFNKNLSRKDLLYRNLDNFRKVLKVQMPFLPLTYNLPKQFSQLSAKFHEEQLINRTHNYWIMKPIGKSRGRGIKVVSSLSELNYTDNIVVQKYISDPMLIDGYKFDMRIYVLVTNFHPLQAFVYREGFARLSTQKYTLDANSIKNTFVHLTNFAINKNNVSNNTNFAGGSKISLKTLKDRLTRMGHSFSNIWSQVHEIIVKSLLGCSVSVPSFPTAFQLFGYDIMLDQKGNCHLIQINASPSLERSYMIDEIVKQNLIDDIIDLVDPPDFDKKQLLDVLGQRIQAIANKKKITQEDDLIGLARILRYKPIRKVGQKPEKMGLFQVVAPCELSRELETMIKSKSGANNPLNID